MHVTVSFCGIQLDGLQEVPLRFCFLPLGDMIEHSVIIVSTAPCTIKTPHSTEKPKYLCEHLMSLSKPHTHFNNNS